MRAIYVPLTPDDLEALRRAAETEKRRPQDQAAFLITEALRRRRRPDRDREVVAR